MLSVDLPALTRGGLLTDFSGVLDHELVVLPLFVKLLLAGLVMPSSKGLHVHG